MKKISPHLIKIILGMVAVCFLSFEFVPFIPKFTYTNGYAQSFTGYYYMSKPSCGSPIMCPNYDIYNRVGTKLLHFEIIDDLYSKDDLGVHCGEVKMPMDPRSFHKIGTAETLPPGVIQEQDYYPINFGRIYADNKTVRVACNRIIVPNQNTYSEMDGASTHYIGCNLFKDKNNLYFLYRESAIGDHFVEDIVTGNLAISTGKYGSFRTLPAQIVQNLDKDSLTILSAGHLTCTVQDKNGVYTIAIADKGIGINTIKN